VECVRRVSRNIREKVAVGWDRREALGCDWTVSRVRGRAAIKCVRRVSRSLERVALGGGRRLVGDNQRRCSRRIGHHVRGGIYDRSLRRKSVSISRGRGRGKAALG
jgi:hypothetical protein